MACELYSSLNYPVSVPYKGSTLEIPPRAYKLLIMEENQLGKLPKGIKKVSIGKGK